MKMNIMYSNMPENCEDVFFEGLPPFASKIEIKEWIDKGFKCNIIGMLSDLEVAIGSKGKLILRVYVGALGMLPMIMKYLDELYIRPHLQLVADDQRSIIFSNTDNDKNMKITISDNFIPYEFTSINTYEE